MSLAIMACLSQTTITFKPFFITVEGNWELMDYEKVFFIGEPRHIVVKSIIRKRTILE
jgi:hypothetical protein